MRPTCGCAWKSAARPYFFVKQPIAELDTALAVGDVVPIGWLVEQRLMVRKAAAMSFQPASHSMRQPYATHVVQNNPPQAVATLKQP